MELSLEGGGEGGGDTGGRRRKGSRSRRYKEEVEDKMRKQNQTKRKQAGKGGKYMKYTYETVNGLNVHFIETNKFKTNLISVRLMNHAKEDIMTKRALLSSLLTLTTKNYKTEKELSNRLDELYGTSLSSSKAKLGKNTIISVNVSSVNDKYISNDISLIEESFKLLQEVFFNPNVTNNEFDKSALDIEKRMLKEEIDNAFENKTRYGIKRLIEEMCEGELYALSTFGKKEEIDAITENSLYEYFLESLEQDQKEIYVIGEFNKEEIISLIDKYLPFKQSSVVYDALDLETKEIEQARGGKGMGGKAR